MATGRGTIKYDVNKPTFAYTNETTEFDDELIRRGIITKDQAIIRKGATVAEAHRVVKEIQEAAANEAPKPEGTRLDHYQGDDVESDSDYDSDGEDYRAALSQYRQVRLQEYEKERSNHRGQQSALFGEVIPISRSDWKREVNDASQNGQWVVINLTPEENVASISQWNECMKVQVATYNLARKFPNLKFVSIKSTSAVENWPSENLPAMFLYRNGILQHELVGLQSFAGAGINEQRMEWILATVYGVLKTDLTEEPEKSTCDGALYEDESTRSSARGMVGSLITFAQASDQADVLE